MSNGQDVIMTDMRTVAVVEELHVILVRVLIVTRSRQDMKNRQCIVLHFIRVFCDVTGVSLCGKAYHEVKKYIIVRCY